MVLTRIGYSSAAGYERVCLDGKETYAHRIVWEAVEGRALPPRGDLSINHLNGVKTDNRPGNLELATQSEQMRHAYATGLRAGNGLKGVHRTRLSPDEIQRIKSARRGTITEVANDIGISRSYAYQIRSGRYFGSDR